MNKLGDPPSCAPWRRSGRYSIVERSVDLVEHAERRRVEPNNETRIAVIAFRRPTADDRRVALAWRLRDDLHWHRISSPVR
jgi:hypothetical protein